MSYLVLARKWRPKRFAELVGQEHVVCALSNALNSGRVHHAFLFTGTRGVGKTTIARIFAKSLNCEQGTSAEPCGECASCIAIDGGRFIDLLEIDAASNTGVDDVREVIDNAQYMPSRGRVKVYLIDEVHMLSKSAFNALLKTLEEPPGHVKFLLATTDPQKLPVTVLSRCLQFNLKRLDEPQIQGQITKILQAEGIDIESGALRQLAKAADGSLRDGLSLLDQAIAYSGASAGGNALTDVVVASMLGTVDGSKIGALLKALSVGDGAALMETVAALAEFSPDWNSVLDALADALHRIQVKQLVPAVELESEGVDVETLAQELRPEVVHLWYQMALNGRRDLPFAPSPQAGFEMCVLRMLAFRPEQKAQSSDLPASASKLSGVSAAKTALNLDAKPIAPKTIAPKTIASETKKTAVGNAAPTPLGGTNIQASSAPVGDQSSIALDADTWLDLISRSGVRGPARELAAHAAFIGFDAGVLRLCLGNEDAHLRAPGLVKQLADALAASLGGALQIKFEEQTAASVVETLHERTARERDARQSSAEATFLADPEVQRLMSQHGAKVVPDSIRPYDESSKSQT